MQDKQTIVDAIMNPKTKGGEYFQRFFENHTDLFWKFWELNKNPDTDVSSVVIERIGREVESQMFQLENLLTSRQMGSKSTDKTVTAFYDLVSSYFPLYGKIE